MVMCLMKLRLGYFNEDIVDRFGVLVIYVFSVFIIWIKFLSLVFSILVFNLFREVVMLNLFFFF